MSHRVPLFGIEIDAVHMTGAVRQIYDWILSPSQRCRFVVTPNIDHVVLLQTNRAMLFAYHDASLVLADGWPLVTASRWLRRPLPERVPGSDLGPRLFAAAKEFGGLKVFLLGAAPGVADRAATKITAQWPQVEVVGTYSPPLGFEKSPAECQTILDRIAAAKPDVLIVGLGAPKQELWVHSYQDQIAAPVALCLGATIDFLAGERQRAPRWIQALRLEWLHRLAGEPRRLFKRYARDAWVFPQLVLKEMFQSGKPTAEESAVSCK